MDCHFKKKIDFKLFIYHFKRELLLVVNVNKLYLYVEKEPGCLIKSVLKLFLSNLLERLGTDVRLCKPEILF
jgi:hypothetical protein